MNTIFAEQTLIQIEKMRVPRFKNLGFIPQNLLVYVKSQ